MGFLVGTLVTQAYGPSLYVTVDATATRTVRVTVPLYKRLMVALTVLVVVSAIQIRGVTLVAAMLVVPVAAATLVARSFNNQSAWRSSPPSLLQSLVSQSPTSTALPPAV